MSLPINLSDLIRGRTVDWERLEFKLDLYEGRPTGIPKVLRVMRANGSPPPEFEFDEEHSYFLARLPVQPDAAQAIGQLVEDATPPVTPPVATPLMRLLELLAVKGPSGNAEIRAVFGLKNRTHLRKIYIEPALAVGLIAPTVSNKPTSRLQQYWLTEKVRAFLEAKRKGQGQS